MNGKKHTNSYIHLLTLHLKRVETSELLLVPQTLFIIVTHIHTHTAHNNYGVFNATCHYSNCYKRKSTHTSSFYSSYPRACHVLKWQSSTEKRERKKQKRRREWDRQTKQDTRIRKNEKCICVNWNDDEKNAHRNRRKEWKAWRSRRRRGRKEKMKQKNLIKFLYT